MGGKKEKTLEGKTGHACVFTNKKVLRGEKGVVLCQQRTNSTGEKRAWFCAQRRKKGLVHQRLGEKNTTQPLSLAFSQ